MKQTAYPKLPIEGDERYPIVERILTQSQIDTFKRDGILVVSGLISEEIASNASEALHRELLQYGVDHNDLESTGENMKKLSSTGGAGGIIDLFYPDWRFEVAQNDRIFSAMTDLYEATYASKAPGYNHPYECFEAKQGFLYINRVCYRLPDSISRKKRSRKKAIQRSLTPHLDCCPTNLHNTGKQYPRWRPIQCFTALTSNDAPNTGGFEAVKGFHHECEQYFKDKDVKSRLEAVQTANMDCPPVCIGDFSPLRTQEDSSLFSRMDHIEYKKGDVVFWDWRIPHANSYNHTGNQPREVIYTGFLPNVPVNEVYVKEQLYRYENLLLPSDHWQKDVPIEDIEWCTWRKHVKPFKFSSLGSRLMGIHPW